MPTITKRRAAACLALLAAASARPAAGMMVEAGRPRAEIVIAEHPARMTRLAVDELQAYLEKISGARLPVVTEPSAGAVPVYVGVSAHTERLGLNVADLRYGAFRMASGGGWLALLGNDRDFEPVEPYARTRNGGSGGRAELLRIQRAWDEITGDTFMHPYGVRASYNADFDVWSYDDRGTLNAVHEFLRGLGVRWYFPGELGEVVPALADIPVPDVNRTVRPDFPVRRLSWWYSFVSTAREDALWRLRLGLHPGHDVLGLTQTVHGMKFVHGREEMKQAHPEFYALWDGERATGHRSGQGAPCLSSEGLFEKHVAYARAVFDHYGEPMLSLDPVDGYSRGVCGCELCRGQATPERGPAGSMSDYVWGYVNRVAEELYRSHPDRLVGGLSYGAYALPPENIERLSPNLAVTLMPARRNMNDPAARREHEESRRAWLEKLPSGKLFTFTNFIHNRTAGLPICFPRAIAEYLRMSRGIISGEHFECYEHLPGSEHDWHPLALAHLDLVVTSCLWWDADQDLDALLEEYYTLYYGPARDEMKAFIEYCEINSSRMRREIEPIDRALELLAAAQAAVAPDSVYARRIGLIADYVRPLENLRAQLARAREGVPRARLLPWGALARRQLDGQLNDETYWPVVRTLALTDLETGWPPVRGRHAWVRVFSAGGAVYFGIYCAEPDTANLDLGREVDGELDIRQGDFVEILLETLTHSYYRITVNPAGVLVDADRSEGGAGERWRSNAEAAVHVGDGYWSAEIRIPLAGEGARDLDPLVGVDGRLPTEIYTWFFNVGRQRVRDGQVERYAYSPTGTGEFEVLDRFAEMWAR